MRISDWSSDVCSSDLARRRRQADLDAVEMVERAPPFAVDAAVTFVDHDEIEIAGRVLFVFVHQRLQGDDGDALFVLEPAAGARHPVAWKVRQMLGERSEERRVRKEWVSTCRSWWWQYHSKKINKRQTIRSHYSTNKL